MASVAKIITLANLIVINRSEFAKKPVPEIMQQFLKNIKVKIK